jgi:hypothetical protein
MAPSPLGGEKVGLRVFLPYFYVWLLGYIICAKPLWDLLYFWFYIILYTANQPGVRFSLKFENYVKLIIERAKREQKNDEII